MIAGFEGLTRTKGMFFEKIRERIPFLNSNKTHLSRKKESERIALNEANQLISNKKHKKALKVINSAIGNGISTNQILAKKAFLLAQINQYDDAKAIWQRLSELKNKPKLAASAKKSLETLEQIKIQNIKSTKHLLNNLHARAQKYHHKFNHLPKPKDWDPGTSIITFICKEAELARTAELPKLAADLAEQALRAGQSSPLLINEKALSLGMMGQHSTALELLETLSREIKNPDIKDQINKCRHKLNTDADYYNSKKLFYLAKQSILAMRYSGIEIKFIPEDLNAHAEQETRSLIFREASDCLDENPETSLWIANSILDYYPGDGASLQLKGEALAELNRSQEALKAWEKLIHSAHKETAKRASMSTSKMLTSMALHTSTFNSPAEAISFYIREHLKRKLAPTFNNELKPVLEQLEPSNTDYSDPELEQQQLQLVFNTLVIEQLEAQLSEQGHMNITTTGQ